MTPPAVGQCREFSLPWQEGGIEGFVVATSTGHYAYLNRCPHTGAPLNWQPEQFLNFDNDMIQCALHGALFRIEDGHCLHGPCQGQALQALPLRYEQGQLVIELEKNKQKDSMC